MSILDTVRQAIKPDGTTRGVPVDLDFDGALHLISNDRRRRIITILDRNNTQVDKRTLAKVLAGWEHHTRPARLGSQTYKSVYVALHQEHLPVLAEHGVIEYEPDRGTVTPTTETIALAGATRAFSRTLNGGEPA